MSGICAILRQGHADGTAEILAEMADGLVLDMERVERKTDGMAGVGLAARFPTQQLYDSGRVMIACDADLYNEPELHALVGKHENVAALVSALYERFGHKFPEKLRGSFSVVLWDRREHRLLAAIDGFGVNRLVYYETGNTLIIASRIEALTRAGIADFDVNPRAIVNILNYTSNLGPETIFSNVQRLPPGAVLIASEGKLNVRSYWDMRYGMETHSDEARLSRELEALVEDSVRTLCKEQRFDRIGAFLSGGTDSSTVVGMMTRAAQGGPVKAFSIGFQEQPFNEMEYARLAAKKFRSEHHTHLLGVSECFDAIPRLIRFFDEPFGNASAIPTYFCARLAAEHGVKTLLAGDGGDELFGGNERYATDKIFETYHSVPPFIRRNLIEPALRVVPVNGGIVRRARGYVRRANIEGVERMFTFQFLSTHPAADIFEDGFLKALGNYSFTDVPRGHYTRAAARDHLDRLLYVDVKITLADNDLPKVTCMSEMAGIQARFPFLDRPVAEFSGRIPARLKVKGLQKRYLFKRAFRDLLPAEIIRKKKHGFGIPVATWMKTDSRMRQMSRDILFSQRSFERGYFRRSFIEDLFRRHDADDSTYYGDTLWTFLALELWHRQFVDKTSRVTA